MSNEYSCFSTISMRERERRINVASNDVYIVDGCRTAIGEFGRALAGVSAVDLGATVIREVVRRASLEPSDIEEVMMGNVRP